MASVRAKPKMTYRIGRRSASQFSIGPNVPLVEPSAILEHVDYRDDWVRIVPQWNQNSETC